VDRPGPVQDLSKFGTLATTLNQTNWRQTQPQPLNRPRARVVSTILLTAAGGLSVQQGRYTGTGVRAGVSSEAIRIPLGSAPHTVVVVIIER
jgi:hypothetical protein